MKIPDVGRFFDSLFHRSKILVSDQAHYRARWMIRRWASEADYLAGKDPHSISEFEKNLLLNEGINELWTILCSSGGTKFDNTNARLGVGNSATAAAATDTALLGASTLFKAMDGGFPTFGTLQKATWRSTFQSADANFAWEEFTVDNGATPLKNLNRKVSAQGMKVAGQVWELTLEITLS